MKLRQLQIKRILLFVCKPFAKKINFYPAQQLLIIAPGGFIMPQCKESILSRYLIQLFKRINLLLEILNVYHFLLKRINGVFIKHFINIKPGKNVSGRTRFCTKSLLTIAFLLAILDRKS